MRPGWYANPVIRDHVGRRKLSVRALAVTLGYSASHLYNVIQGRVPMRRVAGERIAELLDTDFFVLFRLVQNNEDEHGNT